MEQAISPPDVLSADMLRAQLVGECRAMASHALANGSNVPSWVLEAGMLGPELGPEELKKIARAHAELCSLCAPATPALILALQADAKSGRRSGLATTMMITAALSLAAFLGISLSGTINDPRSGNILTSSGWPLLVNELFFLSAASLGASFAALLQLDRDLKQGTFDPRSRLSYWVRFILGLVSGVLLATLLHLGEGGRTGEMAVAKRQLSAAALALLGGFGSSVVERLLQRILESIETLLRGSSEAVIAAREEALRARLRARPVVEPSPEPPAATPGLPASEAPSAPALSEPRTVLPPPVEEGPGVTGELAVRAVVEDESAAPIAGARYEIRRGDQIVGSGSTDAGGNIRHPVAEDQEYGLFILREAAPGEEPSKPVPAPSTGPLPVTGPLTAKERARCAYHAARRELSRGLEKHGSGTWETTGKNRGPLVDEYHVAVAGAAGADPWCGMFQGFAYLRAGFKTSGQIPAGWTPDQRSMPRKTMFLSSTRLMLYLTRSGCEHVVFPTVTEGGHPKTREACEAWLRAHLNPIAPGPGDIVLFNTTKPYSHVGMVASYDPERLRLTTYEGNLGDRAGAWEWDLADPTATGFYRVNLIGRLSEGDFDHAPEVPPDGPSTAPLVEAGAPRSAV